MKEKIDNINGILLENLRQKYGNVSTTSFPFWFHFLIGIASVQILMCLYVFGCFAFAFLVKMKQLGCRSMRNLMGIVGRWRRQRSRAHNRTEPRIEVCQSGRLSKRAQIEQITTNDSEKWTEKKLLYFSEEICSTRDVRIESRKPIRQIDHQLNVKPEPIASTSNQINIVMFEQCVEIITSPEPIAEQIK